MGKFVHALTKLTLGELVNDLLKLFIENTLTKKTLSDVIKLFLKYLPSPNNMVKSKHILLKLLKTLFCSEAELVKKHRICNSCHHYVGLYSESSSKQKCQNCSGLNLNGVFYEFNLRGLIKTSFENRKLKQLIDEHKMNENINKSYVCDFTSADEYL